MIYEFIFLKALLLTISIETLILYIIFRTIYRQTKISLEMILLTGIIASSATLPYIWFILPIIVKSRLLYQIIGESFALFIESFIIWGFLKIKFSKSILVSAICNLSSYLIGLLIKLY
jgi:hypothetical protein